ncbi:vWA domain-containing protein [Flavobacterium sp. TN-1]
MKKTFLVLSIFVLSFTACKQSPDMMTEEMASEAEINNLMINNPEIETPEENRSEESYAEIEENKFETPNTKPLSTFSIDVDNASYTNIRRFINNGQEIPKDAVRLEEMINYFSYSYPQPKDNHPFSINTEYSECPWNSNHKLLKIGLQGKKMDKNNLPPSNIVFLIDVSGSMEEENKLPLLKESMKILVKELRPQDKVSMVVYAGAAGMILPPTSGNEKNKIMNALDKLTAGGSTAGGEGIELAYKIAEENFIKEGNNRIVLATDGDFNVGASTDKEMEHLIERKRKTGIFLTCLGYGMGNYKDSKMETLANKGNGNYAYIDNMQEATRFLGKEFNGSMFTIAKDVKIQIEFNPNQIQSYRLIGYENRKLNNEDFKNDAIDAGELGSGHTVTALYEIIPTGVESSYSPTQLKYTSKEGSQNLISKELATIKFRYKRPDGEKSIEMIQTVSNLSKPLKISSSDFKFASSVAWFGMKLRDSKYIENKQTEDIIALANKGIHNDLEGYKTEFIRLIKSAKL